MEETSPKRFYLTKQTGQMPGIRRRDASVDVVFKGIKFEGMS